MADLEEALNVDFNWMPYDDNLLSPVDDDYIAVDLRPPLPSIIKVNDEIQLLEDQLTRLRLHRLHLLSSTALINTIPPEVLSRIFELGTHQNIHLVPTLTLVSRHWRSTALHTPSLWSYIRLDHDWNYGRGTEFMRKIQVYMARAGDAKISVDLDFRYCESLSEARTILGTLRPHLARCFAFRASVPDWEWMVVIAEIADNMHASLEEFSLRIDPGDAEDTAPIPFLKGSFPRLHTLTLEQTPLACAFSHGSAPNLRRFSIVRDTRFHTTQRIRLGLREYLNALSSSPTTLSHVKLQNALFSLEGTESCVFYASPERTVVPSLTHLSFCGVDASNIALLLDAVELPSLFSLSVQMDSNGSGGDGVGGVGGGLGGLGGPGSDLSWLTPLASAAQTHRLPSLRQLELRNCTTDTASALTPLIRCLHALPHLQALGIYAPPSGCAGARLFELLGAGPSRTGRWLVPELRALRLAGCRDVTGHEVLRVVQAREEASRVAEGEKVRRVRSVRIRPCYPLDPEVVEMLRGSVDELRIEGY